VLGLLNSFLELIHPPFSCIALEPAAGFIGRSSSKTCDGFNMQKMTRELFFVPPMDCKSVESLPKDHDWQYEIKFDGYSGIALKQHGEVQLFSRRGNSLTEVYPEMRIPKPANPDDAEVYV
jgi:ATP-dependent DNA ligase